jgi:hypothetical protein
VYKTKILQIKQITFQAALKKEALDLNLEAKLNFMDVSINKFRAIVTIVLEILKVIESKI